MVKCMQRTHKSYCKYFCLRNSNIHHYNKLFSQAYINLGVKKFQKVSKGLGYFSFVTTFPYDPPKCTQIKSQILSGVLDKQNGRKINPI